MFKNWLILKSKVSQNFAIYFIIRKFDHDGGLVKVGDFDGFKLLTVSMKL